MTRWAESVSTRHITAQDVGKFVFESICCRFGLPLEIILDHEPGFRGDVLQDLLGRLKVNIGIPALTTHSAMVWLKRLMEF